MFRNTGANAFAKNQMRLAYEDKRDLYCMWRLLSIWRLLSYGIVSSFLPKVNVNFTLAFCLTGVDMNRGLLSGLFSSCNILSDTLHLSQDKVITTNNYMYMLSHNFRIDFVVHDLIFLFFIWFINNILISSN